MKNACWWKSSVWPAAFLAGILLAAALSGCGGSAVSGGGSTAVTVRIGEDGSSAAPATGSSLAAPRPRAAAIPATVTLIRFTIGGGGIDNIVRTFPVTGPTMTVTLQVPSGPGRTILVEALDADGVTHFRGATVIDAAGIALSVTIGMAVDPANPALQSWSVVANTVATSGTLNRVAQGGGIVLAGGTSGEILSSTDGVSWAPRTSTGIAGDISALAFGGGTFLAMTAAGNFSAFPVVWTHRFYGAPADNVDDWSLRGTVVSSVFRIRDLAFGGGTFVAAGDNSILYSLDNGATWSPGTFTGDVSLSSVAYGNNRFIALSGTGDVVLVSADGITWTSSSIGISATESLDLLGFGNGVFIATTNAGTVYTSADGAAWLQKTPFADLFSMEVSAYSVDAGGGGFMVVTSSGLFFTFDAGATWTAVDPLLFMVDGTYWNGAFIAVGSNGPGSVFRSGDL